MNNGNQALEYLCERPGIRVVLSSLYGNRRISGLEERNGSYHPGYLAALDLDHSGE